MRRVIATLAKSVNCMNRTKVTQLVKASVLPAVRRVIAALAKSVDCMNRTKVTQPVKASVLPVGMIPKLSVRVRVRVRGLINK